MDAKQREAFDAALTDCDPEVEPEVTAGQDTPIEDPDERTRQIQRMLALA